MRNRKVQRELRKKKEETLDIRNYYGIKDPTPYEASKALIKNRIQS